MIAFEASLICDGTDRFLPRAPKVDDGKAHCEVLLTGEIDSDPVVARSQAVSEGLKKGWTFDHGKEFCPGCSKFIAKGAKALLRKYNAQTKGAA